MLRVASDEGEARRRNVAALSQRGRHLFQLRVKELIELRLRSVERRPGGDDTGQKLRKDQGEEQLSADRPHALQVSRM